MIYFQRVEQVEKAICNTDIVKWHVLHGWYYHVWECKNGGGKIIGGFYVTLLCGSGGVLHFDCYDPDVSFTSVKSAMQKGIAMVAPVLDLVLATIPVSRPSLIRTARRLGFLIIALFVSGGVEYVLMKKEGEK